MDARLCHSNMLELLRWSSRRRVVGSLHVYPAQLKRSRLGSGLTQAIKTQGSALKRFIECVAGGDGWRSLAGCRVGERNIVAPFFPVTYVGECIMLSLLHRHRIQDVRANRSLQSLQSGQKQEIAQLSVQAWALSLLSFEWLPPLL